MSFLQHKPRKTHCMPLLTKWNWLQKPCGEMDAKGMSGLDKEEPKDWTERPIYNIVACFITSLAGDDLAQ